MVFNLRTFSFAKSDEDNPTPPKSFSLKELRVATRNFSEDNYLGQGEFGNVYRGRLADGSLVAVKRAYRVNQWSRENFEAEMQVGSTISTHPNVLCLRGFCRTKKERLLVYPLMINNTLYYNLSERPDRFARPLDWTTRKRIALGAARGLAHLHNQGNIKIMHHDICPSNILLNVRFEAVIEGFSHAMIVNYDSGSDSPSYHRYEDIYMNTPNPDHLRGRLGFIAPELCLKGKCTLKNDVYAYGKILLVLISGQSELGLLLLVDNENLTWEDNENLTWEDNEKEEEEQLVDNENLTLEKWIGDLMNKNELGRVIDPNLQGNYVEEEAEQLVPFALSCLQWDASARPEMSEVVQMLERQFLQRDPSSRSSWSQSEHDSTPYYSFPPSPSPSPSPLGIAP